ncbi:MAG: DUF4357 domain-containing protein [Defluviitaleaceae bacterium]|nr:DUF4357 domain-containing protein [Defluviitaleaceae bacterium]
MKQGSRIEMADANRIPPGVKKRRQTANVSADGILQEDVLFKSLSYAAAFLIGGYANGLTEWKLADGKTTRKDM